MSDRIHKVELDCGHVRWFKIRPSIDEDIWCPQCGNYEPVSPSTARLPDAKVFHDDFWSRRVGKSQKYEGGCLLTTNGKDCDYTAVTTHGFHTLRDKIHAHIMKTHTRFGATLVITQGERLPKNAPPPF